VRLMHTLPQSLMYLISVVCGIAMSHTYSRPIRGVDAEAPIQWLPGEFERFCGIVKAPLYEYCTRFTDERSFADDLVQETLIIAWQQPFNPDKEASIETYAINILKSVISNTANYWATGKRENDLLLTMDDAAYYAGDSNPDRGILLKQAHAAIAKLPVSLRRVAQMYYIDGMLAVDIANELGISPATVGRWLEKAMEKVRITLNVEVECGEEG